MKRLIFILGMTGLVALGVACTPKKASTTTATPALLTKEVALKQYSSEQIAKGEALNTANCGGCHKLYPAAQFGEVKWNSVLNRMIPKAKVSDEDGKLIRAYIIANSKGAI